MVALRFTQQRSAIQLSAPSEPSSCCRLAIQTAKRNSTDCVVGPRRDLPTSRSTMPLINNNSAHIAQGFADQRTAESEFRAGRRGHQRPREFRVTFSLCSPRTCIRGPPSLETVHWKINTVGIFVGYVAPDILARPLRGVAS